MENKFIEEIKQEKKINRKISEISPIKKFGTNLMKERNFSDFL